MSKLDAKPLRSLLFTPGDQAARIAENAKSGADSQSLLWNLYRRDTAPDSKKCSLLFGLFQYQSKPEGKTMRLFYIPVSRNRSTISK